MIDSERLIGCFKASLRVATEAPRYFTTFSYHQARMSAILASGPDVLYRWADYDLKQVIAANATIRHGIHRDRQIQLVTKRLKGLGEPLDLAAFDGGSEPIEIVLRARMLLKAMGLPKHRPALKHSNALSFLDPKILVDPKRAQFKTPREGTAGALAYQAIMIDKRADPFTESWIMSDLNMSIAYAEAFFPEGGWTAFENYLIENPQVLEPMAKVKKKLPLAEYFHVIADKGAIRYKKKFLTNADHIDGVWVRKGDSAIKISAFMPADTSDWR